MRISFVRLNIGSKFTHNYQEDWLIWLTQTTEAINFRGASTVDFVSYFLTVKSY